LRAELQFRLFGDVIVVGSDEHIVAMDLGQVNIAVSGEAVSVCRSALIRRTFTFQFSPFLPKHFGDCGNHLHNFKTTTPPKQENQYLPCGVV
jgi:hypothetical protein